ncbi:MAG TPA: hypothetical protein VKV25_02640 [Acidimicrobiales bacterium]|nr:hypothetical protein [Acidimicrobiales bacterium]
MSDPQAGPAGPAGGVRPAPPGPAAAPSSLLGPDWPDHVAGRIESVVETVRDKTTVPATKAARAVVFGLLVAVGGIVALILVVIALVRLIDVYLPISPYGRRVWVVYAGLGAIFLLAGVFCWGRRKPRNPA